MSVFKVTLTGGNQGGLDSNALSHSNVSVQRSMFVIGPGKINRKLVDGATFTDSNYWKRYASPAVPVDQAIVTVVTDDGSVWSDLKEENSGPTVYNITVISGTTYAGANGAITISGTTQTYTGNSVNITNDWGSPSLFTQITVSGHNVKCRMNGQAVIDLLTVNVQIFEETLPLSLLEFDNTAGGGTSATIQIVCFVRNTAKS